MKTLTATLFVALAFTGAAGTMPAASASPVTEDDPAWNCAVDGNRICGPDNSSGLVAGCYDDAAELVAAWPCHLVVNPDGSADVYEG